MRPYETGDLVCVHMATSRPLPQPAGDQPTAAVLSAEEQLEEGWLPGIIRSATNDGLYEVELEGRDLIVLTASATLQPRAAGELCAGQQ